MNLSDSFLIVASLPMNIVVFDKNKHVTAISDQMLVRFNLQREEILNQSWEMIFNQFPVHERSLYVAQLGFKLDQVIEGVNFFDDLTAVRENGELKFITYHFTTGDKLRIITDQLPAFVGYFDPEGRYQFANRSYEEWFGIKATELIGKRRKEFMDETTVDIASPYEKLALNGEHARFEIQLTSVEEKRRIFEIQYVPDLDPSTRILRGVVVIGNDVTERVEALRRRDEFLSIASHELKTPLTSLKLQTSLAMKKMEVRNGAVSPGDLVQLVQATERSAERLTRLVEDMLDISRIVNGKLSLQSESFDISEVINSLVIQYSVDHPQIRYLFDDIYTVHGDRFRIEQVLTNLLQNAIKYGNKTPIEISTHRIGSQVEIRVKDHGPGIDPANHERIFQRFERAVGPYGVSGLGLGLFICKEIIERHQGTIRVESRSGEGATFTIALPLL